MLAHQTEAEAEIEKESVVFISRANGKSIKREPLHLHRLPKGSLRIIFQK